MAGFLFLILSFFPGYFIVKKLFNRMFSSLQDIYPETENLRWVLIFPASFLIGSLLANWLTLGLAYAFVFTGQPLFWANLISISLMFLFFCFFIFVQVFKSGLYVHFPRSKTAWKNQLWYLLRVIKKHKVEIILFLIVFVFWSWVVFRSFHMEGNILFIGNSVYSDFGPHTAMIRSFSLGNNIPPQYHHYADGHMRYHFLFQFFAGNLEFLGMNIEWAFNLPSVLAILSFCMLLYFLALVLTRSKLVGIFAVIFLFLRSSWAFFNHLVSEPDFFLSIKKMIMMTASLGFTRAEDWGLWSIKPLVNQRHLAYAMALGALVVIAFLPLLVCRHSKDEEKKSLSEKLKLSWFSAKAWLPASWIRPVLLGVALGMMSYFNGAVLIHLLFVLFLMALFSRHKLEYVIIAFLTIFLTYLVSKLFLAGAEGGAVHPKITLGFMAPDKSLSGILNYFTEIYGIYLFIIVASFIALSSRMKIFILALFMPILFALTVQLTPDIMVNYKYISISVYFLNIAAAAFIVFLLKSDFLGKIRYWGEKGKILFRIIRYSNLGLAIIFIFLMTITGIVDLKILYNIDRSRWGSDNKDPVKLWIQQNTNPRDIFLTGYSVYHPVLLAGRPIFNGWTYFAWSAGYDTERRKRVFNRVFTINDPRQIQKMLEKNNIQYIVIDDPLRHEFRNNRSFNEELFDKHFILVYTHERDKRKIFLNKLKPDTEQQKPAINKNTEEEFRFGPQKN